MWNNYTSTISYPGSKVLEPDEVFDYSSWVISNGNQYTDEPLVGFKIGLKDVTPTRNFEHYIQTRNEHIATIQQDGASFLASKKCMIREGSFLDGNSCFYLVTLPAPLSMMETMVSNIAEVMQMIDFRVNFKRIPFTEVNVSGKINPYDSLRLMNRIHLPQAYLDMVKRNKGMMLGNLEYLTPDGTYAVYRLQFDIKNPSVLEDIQMIAQLISAIF